MIRVFLAGSRKLSRLPEAVRTRLQEIVGREMEVVVGDANGADRAIQSQLAAWNYPSVTVYHVGVSPRNNVGAWPTCRIETPRGARGFDFYATKDRAMAEAADCGLMVWDGISRGTLANVEALVAGAKPVAVYVSPLGRCMSVRSPSELSDLKAHGVSAAPAVHATRAQIALGIE
jgi:hypothetical protein